jgi:hypothetical protein
MTKAEKLKLLEGVLHRIQLYREVTMDVQRLRILLDTIGDWSYAHRAGNGELSEKEVKRAIAYQESRLEQLLNIGTPNHDDIAPKDNQR